MRHRALALLVAALLLVLAPAAVGAGDEGEPGGLYEAVVQALRQTFPDAQARIDDAAAAHRPAARAAASLAREREAAFSFLGEIPSSHTGLLSRWGERHAMADLAGEDDLTLGVSLLRLDDGFFAASVLWDGPAHRAGLRRGDRVVAVDGVDTASSPRLDVRHDDAALDDPPAHWLRCEPGVSVVLDVLRRQGQTVPRRVRVEPAAYSSLRSDRAGVRALGAGRWRIGVVVLSLVYPRQTVDHVRTAVTDTLADCDGFVLDGRGRGGGALAAQHLLALLRRGEILRGRPVVLAVDRGTRSAKELIADGFRRHRIGMVVGERTPGAVRPVRFVDVGHDTVLFCPVPGQLDHPRFDLEGVGVEPDLLVADRLAYADGQDPILDTAVEALRTLLEARDADAGPAAAALPEEGDAALARRHHYATGGEIEKIGADWALGRSALRAGDGVRAERHLAAALARARRHHAAGASKPTWEWLGYTEQAFGELLASRGLCEAALRHLRAGRDALVEAGIETWWPDEKRRLDARIVELERGARLRAPAVR